MLDEKRFKIYIRDNFRCQYKNCKVCGTERIELAHRIHQGKQTENWVESYLLENYEAPNKEITKKTIEEIIHHPLNLVTSCRKHNDYFNCLFKRNDAEKLLEMIIDHLGYKKKE